jgi:hypothetical protein
VIVYRLRRKANEWDRKYGHVESEYCFFSKDKSPRNVLTIYATYEAAERALVHVQRKTLNYEIVAYDLDEIKE